MKVTSKTLALIVFVVLFGGIALTTSLNWWKDSRSKVPGLLSGEETTGQYNPADIRGSFLFGDVSKYFNIPEDVLRKAFSIPADKDLAGLPVKEAATYNPEMSAHSVALFAAYYNGLPYTMEEELFLPASAADILKEHGKMTLEQAAYLEGHVIGIGAVSSTALPVEPAPAVAGTESSTGGNTVTGSTTFQNLLDWGLEQETIERIVGGAMPETSMSVRDYIMSKGEEFSAYKTALQQVLDGTE